MTTPTHRFYSTAQVPSEHPPFPIQARSSQLLAGKDRTGVLAFLLLSLAGADPTVVDHDYALTRVGIEPARDLLEAKLAGTMNLDKNDPVMWRYFEIP